MAYRFTKPLQCLAIRWLSHLRTLIIRKTSAGMLHSVCHEWIGFSLSHTPIVSVESVSSVRARWRGM